MNTKKSIILLSLYILLISTQPLRSMKYFKARRQEVVAEIGELERFLNKRYFDNVHDFESKLEQLGRLDKELKELTFLLKGNKKTIRRRKVLYELKKRIEKEYDKPFLKAKALKCADKLEKEVRRDEMSLFLQFNLDM